MRVLFIVSKECHTVVKQACDKERLSMIALLQSSSAKQFFLRNTNRFFGSCYDFRFKASYISD